MVYESKVGRLIQQRRLATPAEDSQTQRTECMSQYALSRKVHVAASTINKYETGLGVPGVHVFGRICEALSLSDSKIAEIVRAAASEPFRRHPETKKYTRRKTT